MVETTRLAAAQWKERPPLDHCSSPVEANAAPSFLAVGKQRRLKACCIIIMLVY
jgi:hypothetical protein